MPTTTSPLVAPGLAERTRPGHFVALAAGGPDSGLTLRRAFSIYKTSAGVSTAAPSTSWWASRAPAPPGWPRQPPHTPLDVVGPLGRPFASRATR